jgi:hypothetical protein
MCEALDTTDNHDIHPKPSSAAAVPSVTSPMFKQNCITKCLDDQSERHTKNGSKAACQSALDSQIMLG